MSNETRHFKEKKNGIDLCSPSWVSAILSYKYSWRKINNIIQNGITLKTSDKKYLKMLNYINAKCLSKCQYFLCHQCNSNYIQHTYARILNFEPLITSPSTTEPQCLIFGKRKISYGIKFGYLLTVQCHSI